uniref:Interleukin-12 receptor subunit beta-2-like n=1 Tax=Gouania willdenowi TaxID=441366 RepID=A0A8C5DXB7_GOUWI
MSDSTWNFWQQFLMSGFIFLLGKKSCVIWSSGGDVVERGHSFQVFCTFKDKCRILMEDHPLTQQRTKKNKFNETTYYFDVINLTNSRTYSCQCENFPDLDSCGIDISTGYPPDHPTNISCIYKILKNDNGVVVCTWDRGRHTYLRDTSMLWVKTDSGKVYSESPAASLTIPRSVQFISVWVQTQNQLGRINSSIVNYTLSDIVRPSTPSVSQHQCFSTMCIIQLELPVTAANLEIQYRDESDTWTTFTDTSSSLVTSSISHLQPYRFYDFRVRYKFSTGLWSHWSNTVSNWTQEEVPAKELDVWFTQTDSDIKSLRIYWKEADTSISRGKIIQYEIMVTPDPTITRISAEQRNYSVPVCAECEVTVWARNSKGRSPPAKINNRPSKGKPPQDVQVSNTSVSISWKRPHSALHLTAYVLEWYPKGLKLAQLRWLRLGIDDTRSVLSGIKPFECYDGAVFAVYSDGTVSGQRFTDVATSESVPSAAPQVQENVIGNKLSISWTEIPRSQRGGCITKYTIYVEDESERQTFYPVASTQRLYTMADVSSGVYRMWMSASTAKGEGPLSQKVKLYIKRKQLQRNVELWLLVILMNIFVFVFAFSCIPVRFCKVFHFFMPDPVPDPANSKWAKGYNQDKGKMNLQLQLSNYSVGMEEDPVLVDVEELHEHNGVTYAHTISSQLSPQSPELCPLYPLTTYIKTFSQDSDSSEHTQASMDTTTTVDYITAHGSASSDEEYKVEEEDCADMHFFPSLNIFAEPLESRGSLTLDAVRIDCTNVFEHI